MNGLLEDDILLYSTNLLLEQIKEEPTYLDSENRPTRIGKDDERLLYSWPEAEFKTRVVALKDIDDYGYPARIILEIYVAPEKFIRVSVINDTNLDHVVSHFRYVSAESPASSSSVKRPIHLLLKSLSPKTLDLLKNWYQWDFSVNSGAVARVVNGNIPDSSKIIVLCQRQMWRYEKTFYKEGEQCFRRNMALKGVYDDISIELSKILTQNVLDNGYLVNLFLENSISTGNARVDDLLKIHKMSNYSNGKGAESDLIADNYISVLQFAPYSMSVEDRENYMDRFCFPQNTTTIGKIIMEWYQDLDLLNSDRSSSGDAKKDGRESFFDLLAFICAACKGKKVNKELAEQYPNLSARIVAGMFSIPQDEAAKFEKIFSKFNLKGIRLYDIDGEEEVATVKPTIQSRTSNYFRLTSNVPKRPIFQ